MSRTNIPIDRPLSGADRAYLLMRGEDARVKWFDDTYPPEVPEEELDEDDEEELDDGYDELTVAALQARIAELNAEGAEITPASTKKADLIAALREYDARPDDEE